MHSGQHLPLPGERVVFKPATQPSNQIRIEEPRIYCPLPAVQMMYQYDHPN